PTAAGKSSGCLRRYVKFMGSSFTREIGTAHHFIKRYFATSLFLSYGRKCPFFLPMFLSSVFKSSIFGNFFSQAFLANFQVEV
ncbi:MAG: hypothetical protein ACOZAN_00970, partial [Patescibacteria group bacterium]